MMQSGALLDFGVKILFVLPDAQGEFPQEPELLGEQESGERGKLEPIQEAQPFGPKEIAARGQSQPRLGTKESMKTIADHRALPHKETPLAQHFFNLSGGLPADVHPRNELAA